MTINDILAEMKFYITFQGDLEDTLIESKKLLKWYEQLEKHEYTMQKIITQNKEAAQSSLDGVNLLLTTIGEA